MHLARDHDAGRVSDLDEVAGAVFWRSVYDLHAASGELEVATLRLDEKVYRAASLLALVDPPAYRVFDGRLRATVAGLLPGAAPGSGGGGTRSPQALPGARLDEQRGAGRPVASTWAKPRWAVTADLGPAARFRRRQRSGHDGGRAVKAALTAGVQRPHRRRRAAVHPGGWSVRGRARPRVASWGIWAVVQAVGTVSAFGARQLPAACYTLFCAAGCAAVVFLGWRHGSRDFGPLDAVCLALAAEGVALLAVAAAWPRLVPMSWAVAVSVGTDFLAYLPTFGHAWRKPDEEPWLPSHCSVPPPPWSCGSRITGS